MNEATASHDRSARVLDPEYLVDLESTSID